VLQEAALRLTAAVRSSDLVARLGGDEFVLLLEGFGDASELAEIANKVLANLEPAFVVGGQELALSASIGVCTYPQGGLDAQTLLSNADIAMYRAKEQGRNRFCFYAAPDDATKTGTYPISRMEDQCSAMREMGYVPILGSAAEEGGEEGCDQHDGVALEERHVSSLGVRGAA